MNPTLEPGVMECCGYAVDPELNTVNGDVCAYWTCQFCNALARQWIGPLDTSLAAVAQGWRELERTTTTEG